MIRFLAFVFALLSWPAVAQDIFPALYDVTGVAAQDVLNVRAEPSANEPIIGAFTPSETGIEVIALSDDGGWGRVNTGEQAGWVSMRFLARQPGQTAQDWSITRESFAPRNLECFGTEPFWDLTLRPGGTFEFTDPFQGDGSALAGTYEPIQSSVSTGKQGFFGVIAGDPTGFALTGIINREMCSDGMSDRRYGLAIDLIRGDPTGERLDAGCCRLVP